MTPRQAETPGARAPASQRSRIAGWHRRGLTDPGQRAGTARRHPVIDKPVLDQVAER